MMLTTPAMASEPYSAEAPSRSTSRRWIAPVGKVARSTGAWPVRPPAPNSAVVCQRLPLTRTRVWLGLRPRSWPTRIMLPRSEALARTGVFQAGRVLLSASNRSVRVVLSSSWALITSIGAGLFSMVRPVARAPVTVRRSRVVATPLPLASGSILVSAWAGGRKRSAVIERASALARGSLFIGGIRGGGPWRLGGERRHGPSKGRKWSALCGSLGGAQRAQEVAAPDRGDLLAGVAAAQQLGGDVGRVGLAVEALDAGAVIEVGADAHVLHADAPGDVVDVVDQVGQRGRLLV